MVFNALTVATAVTPAVLETYFSHFLNRAPLRQKPTAHISYHEGLRLIRQFLDYASKHTVEDIQGFTGQWVPAPTWVRIQDVEIAPQFLERGARILSDELGWKGIERVGGKTWWQWRRPESPLKAEWIEMRKDFVERKRKGEKCDRVILYIHGGAYYFGSVDEHRYQMQRHARKLKARVLAPRYRLAPQYPFPCGLYDCIAVYLYLLEHFPPEQILFGGDSAGGGMVLSLLVVLRDQGLPLPAGTILLSPWVDLTHSFPSVAGDDSGDYIPSHGFLHRPSMAWPPPPNDEIKKPESSKKAFDRPIGAVELPATAEVDLPKDGTSEGAQDGEVMVGTEKSTSKAQLEQPIDAMPGIGENLSITIDDEKIELKEQIQLYAPNDLLSHPFVSPVLQPSLGGLPPMLIQVGGGELLRDEQIYLAHKAANPKAYPPNNAIMKEYDPTREILNRYPPTDVQLQVWDDLCPKYMYRSVAQFGAWALAHAQNKGIDIQDDDAVSFISEGPDTADEADASASSTNLPRKETNAKDKNDEGTSSSASMPHGAVGRAGDPLPPFKNHMVRQRVTRHGVIYPLALPAELACLHLDPASIGTIKQGPVRKWLAAKKVNDRKFANAKKKVQKKRAKELEKGYDSIPDESPPATAIVNRRRNGVAPEQKKRGKSWGLAMWSGWGSHHDERTLEREEKAEDDSKTPNPTETTVQPAESNAPPSGSLAVPGPSTVERKTRRASASSYLSAPWSTKEKDKTRSKSPYKDVTDSGQADDAERRNSSFTTHGDEGPAAMPRRGSVETQAIRAKRPTSTSAPIPLSSLGLVSAPTASDVAPSSIQVSGSENTFLSPNSQRPHNGIAAYPFKLRTPHDNSSILTLDSTVGSSAVSTAGTEGKRDDPVELPAGDERFVTVAELPGHATTTRDPEFIAGLSTSPVRGSPVSNLPSDRSPTIKSKTSTPVFDHRTSVLGRIGADGMPVAPLSPQGTKISSLNTARTPNDNIEVSPDEAVSPIDSDTSKPMFKIRNPVYDPRVPSTSTVAPENILPRPEQAQLAAPLRLRNTTHDPSAASPVSPLLNAGDLTLPKHETFMEPTLQGSQYQGPTATELPAKSNIALPLSVTHTHTQNIIPGAGDAPPTPPPKDTGYGDALHEQSTSVSGILPSAAGVLALPNKNTSPSTFGRQQSSSALLKPDNDRDTAVGSSSPQRPPLETFVTAREEV
nr:ab hydrolase superfamily protein c4a8.06c [Quercus suber]